MQNAWGVANVVAITKLFSLGGATLISRYACPPPSLLGRRPSMNYFCGAQCREELGDPQTP